MARGVGSPLRLCVCGFRHCLQQRSDGDSSVPTAPAETLEGTYISKKYAPHFNSMAAAAVIDTVDSVTPFACSASPQVSADLRRFDIANRPRFSRPEHAELVWFGVLDSAVIGAGPQLGPSQICI